MRWNKQTVAGSALCQGKIIGIGNSNRHIGKPISATLPVLLTLSQ
jgi:hypothetical protein